MVDALLEMTGVEHRAGTFTLSIERFVVNEGDRLVILGRNGAGKSTLVRLLALVERPASGSVSYRGERIATAARAQAVRRRFSTLFQRPVAFRGTVEDNLRLACWLKGVRARGEDIERSLEEFGLAGRRGVAAAQLSGGEARRLSLAMALVTDPEVLFLDEPTAFLDAAARREFEELVRAIAARREVTIVFVTHDRSEALALGTRVALVSEGRLLQEGPIDEVFAHPSSVEAAELTGSLVVARGRLRRAGDGMSAVETATGATVFAAPGIEVREGSEVAAVIRPDSVLVERNLPEAGQSARNVFRSRVVSVRPRDGVVEVALDAGFPLRAFVTSEAARELELREGAEVFATFKATSVRLVECVKGGDSRGDER